MRLGLGLGLGLRKISYYILIVHISHVVRHDFGDIKISKFAVMIPQYSLNLFIATQYYPDTVKITTARNNTSIRVLAIFLSFLVNKLFVDVGRFIDKLYLIENLLSIRVIIDNIS